MDIIIRPPMTFGPYGPIHGVYGPAAHGPFLSRRLPGADDSTTSPDPLLPATELPEEGWQIGDFSILPVIGRRTRAL